MFFFLLFPLSLEFLQFKDRFRLFFLVRYREAEHLNQSIYREIYEFFFPHFQLVKQKIVNMIPKRFELKTFFKWLFKKVGALNWKKFCVFFFVLELFNFTVWNGRLNRPTNVCIGNFIRNDDSLKKFVQYLEDVLFIHELCANYAKTFTGWTPFNLLVQYSIKIDLHNIRWLLIEWTEEDEEEGKKTNGENFKWDIYGGWYYLCMQSSSR